MPLRRPILTLFLFLVALPDQAAAQRTDTATSPFAGFETRILPNGLKVWFKQARGFRDVSVTVAVPGGSDDDPPGKEQLAHFTEHMAFSDHNGRSEEAINRELDDRGGTTNAFTGADRTFYYAQISRPHGLFAVNWMYGIVSPKALHPAVVEKQRDPVLIEVGAKPRGIDDWITALYIDPPLLRTSGYWKREFGMNTLRQRDVYNWRSVRSIDSAAMRNFYDTYYTPIGMTLTIIGDLPADSVWALIDTTFATLPRRPAPPARPPLVDPAREFQWHAWQFGASNSYHQIYKSYGRSARDELVLAFITRYLGEVLNNKLRFGQHKAVYGISVFNRRRGQAAELTISATVKKGELDYVRSTVESEIERLRTGAVSDSEFVALRGTITGKIRSQAITAAAIEAWIHALGLDRRETWPDFPDPLTEMSALTKAEVQSVAARVFVPERHYRMLAKLIPVPHTVLYLVVGLVLLLSVRLGRAALVRELPMERLRYVARIKGPLLYRLAAVTVYAAVVLVLFRLAIYLGTEATERWVLKVDSFLLQAILAAMAVAAAVLFFIGVASLVPTKVLVFDDGLAIKFLSFRSSWIPFGDIEEMAMRRSVDVARERGVRSLSSAWLMTPAILHSALYLRLKNGRSWFLRSRDTEELSAVILSNAKDVEVKASDQMTPS